jgi:hypothetical protein
MFPSNEPVATTRPSPVIASPELQEDARFLTPVERSLIPVFVIALVPSLIIKDVDTRVVLLTKGDVVAPPNPTAQEFCPEVVDVHSVPNSAYAVPAVALAFPAKG